MSLDGYIDDSSGTRLMLSNEADLDQVDALRASCDAIMVGAATIRSDNPRLLVRSADRRAERVAAGRPPSPVKVTLTGTGHLDPGASFFTAVATTTAPAPALPLVYAAGAAARRARSRLGAAAEIVGTGENIDLGMLLDDLGRRGVGRLLVEGGSSVHAQFLSAGLADELRLAIAPFFVADPAAPRFAAAAAAHCPPRGPARLANATKLGDIAVLTYALSNRFAS
jgi:riboflavin-specific deaminase-like protein